MRLLTVAAIATLVALPVVTGCGSDLSESPTEPVGTDEGDISLVPPSQTVRFQGMFRYSGGRYTVADIYWVDSAGNPQFRDWEPTRYPGIRGVHPTVFFGVPQMEVFNEDQTPYSRKITYTISWNCSNGTSGSTVQSDTLAKNWDFFSYTLTCSGGAVVGAVWGTLKVTGWF